MTGLEDLGSVVALGVVAVMFVSFMIERYPPEVTAVAGVAVLLALGVLETPDVLGTLSNSAPATIAAMFVLSAALARTGALDTVARRLGRLTGHGPRWVLFALMAIIVPASAFLNNTPVVMVMIPVVIGLCRSMATAPSRLLIPMSYATILGGTCSLIGTSTNLLVDGIARDLGLPPFGLFEITPLGLIIVAIGGAFVLVYGVRLLPDRETMASLLGPREPQRFLVEVLIPQQSAMIGRRAVEVDAFSSGDCSLVDVVRGDLSLRRAIDEVVLKAGDRVVLKSSVADVMALREGETLKFADSRELAPVASRESMVVEALLGPGAKLLGKSLLHLRIRRRYGVYPLALHRQGENIEARLEKIPLKVGDTLLLEGAPEDLRRLAEDMDLLSLAEPQQGPYRRSKAPIAIAILIGVILGATFEVLPIAGMALIGVAAVLLCRCVDAAEAFQAVDWRLLVLILSMLAVGESLNKTGAIALIADKAAPGLAEVPPILVLAAVYAVVSILTEAVTNNAVAVVATPIVVALADQLGFDSRPFLVVVMFAASASFATPIGYQTNTLVYNAGGYRFTDFLRVGLPMNVLVGIVTVLVTPLIWPF